MTYDYWGAPAMGFDLADGTGYLIRQNSGTGGDYPPIDGTPLGPIFRQNTTWDLGAPSTDNNFRLLPVHLHLMGGIRVVAVIQESQLCWVARLLAPSCFISPRRFQAKSNSAGPLIRESQWCCGARLLAPSCFIYYLVWGARLLAISS